MDKDPLRMSTGSDATPTRMFRHGDFRPVPEAEQIIPVTLPDVKISGKIVPEHRP